ncbi:alpha-galactosidase, partial [Eubacteriales bacterium OttesenSCG-928-G02]|nr:alpha-galactosidase [Eubacteriales bacterium OttesenSCG-928-G02]
MLEDAKWPILDDIPQEYSAFGRGDLRNPALEVINSDGTNIADLQYKSYKIIKGKPSITGLPSTYGEAGDNLETLAVELEDKISKITVILYYSVFEDYDIITRYTDVINNSNTDVTLRNVMSACIDFDHKNFDVISNYGTHCRERMIERFPL